MKKNIVKLIIGLFATGTVVTTSTIITTKVVENKENKMIETKSNNTVISNISEETNNKIENKVEEENIINEVVENNQQTVTASINYDDNAEKDNIDYTEKSNENFNQAMERKAEGWNMWNNPQMRWNRETQQFEEIPSQTNSKQQLIEQQQTQTPEEPVASKEPIQTPVEERPFEPMPEVVENN